jgi:ectoine hydroxylase-related dioxygenase (phytanoyl-CoA dioxygenase family)
MNAMAPVLRDQYLSDGYVVARGLVDEAELRSISREIAELFRIQLRRLGLRVAPDDTREAFRTNTLELLKADVQTYISTARLTQMLPSVHRLLISEPIMDLVRCLGLKFPLISTRASIHIMSDELKIPNGYHKSPPHQDWRSMQGSLDAIVLWLPLFSVSERSHPLEIVPRSHIHGLMDTVEHIMTPAVEDRRASEDMFVSLPVEPGDVIFFSSFLVHRTGEHGDGLVRVALSGRFNNAVEQTFVEHGYPTPYSYSYRKDLIFPNFPTVNDMKTIYPAADPAA